jgi:hypothetical protein
MEWLREFIAGATVYRGLPSSLMATLGDERSALHASCLAMREAGARLLKRAQDSGHIRPDVDGTDLFALIGAVGWITDQAPSIDRAPGASLFAGHGRTRPSPSPGKRATTASRRGR